MTDVVKFAQFARYPDLYISRRLTQAVQRDGLIEPLLTKNGEIHESSIERFEAFCRIAEASPTGVDNIIVVDWADLDDDEKAEY